jgi:hypothetical protein
LLSHSTRSISSCEISIHSIYLRINKLKGGRKMMARTRTIEISSCCHIKDDAVDSQQYSASVKATEMLQGLWRIGSIHHSGWVCFGHPRVSCLEFIWDGGGLGFGGEYYALDCVQNVQEKRCVYRCSKFERKNHDNQLMRSESKVVTCDRTSDGDITGCALEPPFRYCRSQSHFFPTL